MAWPSHTHTAHSVTHQGVTVQNPEGEGGSSSSHAGLEPEDMEDQEVWDDLPVSPVGMRMCPKTCCWLRTGGLRGEHSPGPNATLGRDTGQETLDPTRRPPGGAPFLLHTPTPTVVHPDRARPAARTPIRGEGEVPALQCYFPPHQFTTLTPSSSTGPFLGPRLLLASCVPTQRQGAGGELPHPDSRQSLF